MAENEMSGVGATLIGGAFGALIAEDERACDEYLGQMSASDVRHAHRYLGILQSKLTAVGAIHEIRAIKANGVVPNPTTDEGGKPN